jgi:SAM-dependent methyltransferase
MTVLDLYCGRGGWTKAFLARGHRVVGVDLTHDAAYPKEAVFVQADCLTFSVRRGSVDLVVASSPCEEFSRFQMPWTRARHPPYPSHGIALFYAARRIAHEAGVPVLLENVRAAQNFVGRATTHVGPFYLWGDAVPPFLPMRFVMRKKEAYGSKERARRAEIPSDLALHVAAMVS